MMEPKYMWLLFVFITVIAIFSIDFPIENKAGASLLAIIMWLPGIILFFGDLQAAPAERQEKLKDVQMDKSGFYIKEWRKDD